MLRPLCLPTLAQSCACPPALALAWASAGQPTPRDPSVAALAPHAGLRRATGWTSSFPVRSGGAAGRAPLSSSSRAAHGQSDTRVSRRPGHQRISVARQASCRPGRAAEGRRPPITRRPGASSFTPASRLRETWRPWLAGRGEGARTPLAGWHACCQPTTKHCALALPLEPRCRPPLTHTNTHSHDLGP